MNAFITIPEFKRILREAIADGEYVLFHKGFALDRVGFEEIEDFELMETRSDYRSGSELFWLVESEAAKQVQSSKDLENYPSAKIESPHMQVVFNSLIASWYCKLVPPGFGFRLLQKNKLSAAYKRIDSGYRTVLHPSVLSGPIPFRTSIRVSFGALAEVERGVRLKQFEQSRTSWYVWDRRTRVVIAEPIDDVEVMYR